MRGYEIADEKSHKFYNRQIKNFPSEKVGQKTMIYLKKK